MKSFRSIAFCMLACVMLSSTGQTTSQDEWEWYLEEVVNDVFVARNDFEFYYSPSKAEMDQQRRKGEVTYFLSSPAGLSVKKTQNLIDQIMASYDDIKATSDWHMEKGSYWKDFRYEKNKFHFSVGRKTIEDGDAHFVSVTETAGFYKSLGKGKKSEDSTTKKDSATKRSSRNRNRKAITQEDVEQHDIDNLQEEQEEQEDTAAVVEELVQPKAKSVQDIRRENHQKQEALKQERRLAQQREKEQQREQQRAQKEAEKLKKAEAKKQKEEEERLKREQQKKQREQERAEAKAEREKLRAQKTQKSERKQASSSSSKYHLNDVALWLSEKYDFTQTAATRNSCTMFSTMVHDTEMAKLAIKNCLKGSNARMAVPWRVNNENHAVETGYTVDDHVLVFTIGKDQEERVTLTVTEVSNEEFELFKQGIQQ